MDGWMDGWMDEVTCPGPQSSNGCELSLFGENYFSELLVSHLEDRSDNNSQ